jgi:hypothetical protein
MQGATPMLACGPCLPVPCGPPFDQNVLKHILLVEIDSFDIGNGF